MGERRRGDGPDLPAWVPDAARFYLSHTESGRSIRALARERGLHASTILRQVRRIENRRDDPLVDAAIEALAGIGPPPRGDLQKESTVTTTRTPSGLPRAAAGDEAELDREGWRILRRMVEPGAVMALAPDMEKAVVVRDTPDGRTVRTATLDRALAEAMALCAWIEPVESGGRVNRYRVASAGRSALRRMASGDASAAPAGCAEAPAAFAGCLVRDSPPDLPSDAPRRVARSRHVSVESPITLLARRRDRDGSHFLSDDLVAAAERLREDFEMAQVGTAAGQGWDRLMEVVDAPAGRAGSVGSTTARDRVRAALRDLGPGLGDVALRCCCYLEGLEIAERRMGWSSRSGKIVLRIALQRLRRHYEETGGMKNVLIG